MSRVSRCELSRWGRTRRPRRPATPRAIVAVSHVVGRFPDAADPLVLPAQYEAFALTIIDARTSRRPVITMMVPGAGDCLRHDKSGLLQHDPLDTDEPVALLERVLADVI